MAAGLTQEELAEKSGLSVRAVSDIERGRSGRPHRASLDRIADALQLPAAERTTIITASRQLPPAGGAGPTPAGPRTRRRSRRTGPGRCRGSFRARRHTSPGGRPSCRR
jgi:transcriptional regulator with XRE-family HTH domain